MSGHGGARNGAGRKRVEPKFSERLAIGARCEELQNAAALAASHKKADTKLPKRLRDLQEQIRANRAKRAAAIRQWQQAPGSAQTIKALRDEFKRYEAQALARIQKEITPLLDRAGRVVRGRVRVMTREEVQRQVAKECRDSGRPLITSRRVKAYWTEYNNFLREVQRSRET
jgi:hypothetical protein